MPVSESDIANLRRAFEQFSARYEQLRAGDIDEYFAEFYDDEAILENAQAFPLPARYQGLDGYRTYFEETYSAYEGVHWTDVHFTPVGERLVVDATISGHPVGDPTELSVRLAITYDMRGGRIAHVRVFLDREQAMQAALAPA